jgi:hypothetical protein
VGRGGSSRSKEEIRSVASERGVACGEGALAGMGIASGFASREPGLSTIFGQEQSKLTVGGIAEYIDLVSCALKIASQKPSGSGLVKINFQVWQASVVL